MLLLAMFACLVDAPLQAKPSAAEKEIPLVAYENSAAFQLKYPKGWVIEDHGRIVKHSGQWEVDIYLGSLWWSAIDRKKPWAHIHISHRSYDHFASYHDFYKGKKRIGCPVAKVRNLEDYLHEMDCERRDQSCEPCADQKCPRPPIGGSCGYYSTTLKLPWGKGYLYRSHIMASFSKSPEFNASVRRIVLLYDIEGGNGFYRFEFTAPKRLFERYSPHFQAVVDSFQLK